MHTERYFYARWLDGTIELYDLQEDPLEIRNLAGDPQHRDLLGRMQALLKELQARRGDKLVPCTQWKDWLDNQRRVVRNAFGPLSHPEGEPDWSLLV